MPTSFPMTDEDFDAYLQCAQDELEAKQRVLADAYATRTDLL